MLNPSILYAKKLATPVFSQAKVAFPLQPAVFPAKQGGKNHNPGTAICCAFGTQKVF